MLEIKNLKKTYGKKHVLNGITFKTDQQVIGILGPNGAGKTTLLKIIAGLIKSTDGELVYENRFGAKIMSEKIKIGYLPQNFGLIKSYTLYEHMEYFACMKGMDKKEWTKSIHDILEMVHLEEMKDVKCGKLSGGMVRRVGIAQALLGNPDIVLLDEPTTGLDPEERIRFQNLIHHFGKTCIILISTHILDDAAKICDELLIIDQGNVLYYGTAAELVVLAKKHVKLDSQIEDGYMYLRKKCKD